MLEHRTDQYLRRSLVDALGELLTRNADRDRVHQWDADRESITENRLFGDREARVYQIADELRDGW